PYTTLFRSREHLPAALEVHPLIGEQVRELDLLDQREGQPRLFRIQVALTQEDGPRELRTQVEVPVHFAKLSRRGIFEQPPPQALRSRQLAAANLGCLREQHRRGLGTTQNLRAPLLQRWSPRVTLFF